MHATTRAILYHADVLIMIIFHQIMTSTQFYVQICLYLRTYTRTQFSRLETAAGLTAVAHAMIRGASALFPKQKHTNTNDSSNKASSSQGEKIKTKKLKGEIKQKKNTTTKQ